MSNFIVHSTRFNKSSTKSPSRWLVNYKAKCFHFLLVVCVPELNFHIIHYLNRNLFYCHVLQLAFLKDYNIFWNIEVFVYLIYYRLCILNPILMKITKVDSKTSLIKNAMVLKRFSNLIANMTTFPSSLFP